MNEVNLDDFLAEIEARRIALGITDTDDEACRNIGTRRTAAKRQLLQEIAERCAAAGVEPLAANY